MALYESFVDTELSKFRVPEQPPTGEELDPNRDGGFWARAHYALYEGFHRNLTLNGWGAKAMFEKWAQTERPGLLREQGLLPPEYIDPTTGEPIGLRDKSLPSAPIFDEYRNDYVKWLDLTTKERKEIWDKGKSQQLVQKAKTMGLGKVVNERGELHNPDLLESVINFGVNFVSPEITIPFGGTIKGAMITGGILGTFDSLAYQYANRPEVSLEDAAIVGAASATFAGALSWAGPKLWNWATQRLANKRGGVYKEEVEDVLDGIAKDIKDPEMRSQVSNIIGDDAEEIATMMNKLMDDLPTTSTTTDMVVFAGKEDLVEGAIGRLLKEVGEDRIGGIAKATPYISRLINSGKLSQYDAAILQGKKGQEALAEVLTKRDRAQMETVAKGAGFDTAIDMVDFFYRGGHRKSDPRVINYYRKTGLGFTFNETTGEFTGDRLSKTMVNKNAAFDRVESEQSKIIATRKKDLVRGWNKIDREAKLKEKKNKILREWSQLQEARADIKTYEDTLLVDKVITAEEDVVTKKVAKDTANYQDLALEIREKTSRWKEARRKNPRVGYSQEGGASTDMLVHLAAPAVGGAIGFSANEENRTAGLLSGIMLGYAPVGAYKLLSKRANLFPSHWDRKKRLMMAMQPRDLAAKPWLYLQKLAPNNEPNSAGELLAYQIRSALNQTSRVTANIRGKWINVANEARLNLGNLDVNKNLANVLMKKEKPASDAVAKTATVLRDLFDHDLKQMHRIGIIDGDTFSAVKLARSKQGFFPVVLDDALISNSKDEWIDYFSTNNFNKEALESTVKSITSISNFINEKTRPEIFTYRTVNGRQVASLTTKAAEDLWHRRKTNPFTILHTGSEDTTGLRSILEPWLNRDVVHVTSSYFNYTQRKIAFAEHFGEHVETALKSGKVKRKFDKDFKAKALFTDIGTQSDINMAHYAEQVYYGAAHDNRSINIKASANRNPFLTEIEGSAMALNTLLLSLAQIYNVGQAFAFSTVKLANYGQNPISALMTVTKQVARTFNNKSQVLQDFGAAVEVAMVQQLGELNTSSHTIFGRDTGVSFIELFNNPSKFLKAIKFIDIEEFNRALASNVGEVTAIRLAQQKIQLEAAQQTNTKAYRQVLSYMKELGMDTVAKRNSIDSIRADELRTAGDIAEAAINFSNDVNFVNDALRMPLAWSHPNSKLLRQFKTFMLHHSSFLHQNIVKPTLKFIASGGKEGTLSPLATYLAVGTAVGATLFEIRSGVQKGLSTPRAMAEGEVEPNIEGALEWILKDDEELTGLQRHINYFGAVGAAGLWGQMATAIVDEGPKGLLEELAGPTFGRVFEVGDKIHTQVQGAEGVGETLNAVGEPIYDTYIRGGLGGVSRAILPELED